MEPAIISEKLRQKCIDRLEPHFSKKNVIKIERGIYDFSLQYCSNEINNEKLLKMVYKDQLRNLLYNLNQDKETIRKIKQNIIQKSFNPYNLAFLKPEELNEDCWKKIIQRKELSEYTLANLPTIEWKPCKACKCKNYYFWQLQLRSADEPMTNFYRCQTCSRVYKVNN